MRFVVLNSMILNYQLNSPNIKWRFARNSPIKKNRGLRIGLKHVFPESPYQNKLSGKFSENLDTSSLIGWGSKTVCDPHLDTFLKVDPFHLKQSHFLNFCPNPTIQTHVSEHFSCSTRIK